MACLCGTGKHLTVVLRRSYPCIKNPNLTVQVRWRKPRWVPVAKTKIFNLRKPTSINEEEMNEMRWRYNHYRTSYKTIKWFLVKWQQDIKTEDISHEEKDRLEREEHQRLMEINRRWNEEVAQQREMRQQQEIFSKQMRLKKEKEQEEDKELEMIEEAIKYVKLETEKSKTFVTEETLDDEIERVLNSRKDYNFALDSEGNKIVNDDKQKKNYEQGG